MDVELARTFLEIVRARSFVRAAEQLNVSQTAVSARIRSDNLARLAGSVALRPFHRAGGWSAPPSRSEPAPATGRAADAVA